MQHPSHRILNGDGTCGNGPDFFDITHAADVPLLTPMRSPSEKRFLISSVSVRSAADSYFFGSVHKVRPVRSFLDPPVAMLAM
jgi:hypothetical protein